MHKHLIIMAILVSVAMPAQSYDALGIMGTMGGIAAKPEEAPPAPKVPSNPAEQPPTATPLPSACAHGAMIPLKVCDLGSGFLCVNTPELSVVGDYIMIRGTTDIKNNQLAGMAISVQNEYTNEYKHFNAGEPEETSDCFNSSSSYCLDSEGYFSLKAPLGDKFGPYSISITATRANGPAVEQKFRTSRVVAPALKKEDIKTSVTENNVTVTVDLLHSCQACDFIGVSTGGVEATFTNIIRGTDSGTRQVTERTNIASGGIFSQCLPLGQGANDINVRVCNAATAGDDKACPSFQLDTITSQGTANGIEWITPVEAVYSADINPEVNLAFRLPAAEGKTCDEANVTLMFNRRPGEKICAGPSGDYKLTLSPETGINVGTITLGEETYSFTFGWGDIQSPYLSGGKVKPEEELWIKNAGGFSIGRDFLTDTVRGLLNNYLRSDEFKFLLIKLPGMFGGGDEPAAKPAEPSPAKKAMDEIMDSIPMCASGNDSKEPNHGIRLSKEPVAELIEIPKIEFKQDAISMVLNAENVSASIEYFADENKDGKPDDRAMPLKIGFRKIFSPFELKVDRSGEKPLFLITGPSTDCEYKSKHACEHRPAVLVPKDFLGNATKGGSFVKCDDKIDKDCIGVNTRNAQTGIFSTTVLDAINKMLYCNGSAAATYVLREYLKEVPVQIGCPGAAYPAEPAIKIGSCKDGEKGRGFILPVGLDLLNDQFQVSEKGISGTVPALLGGRNFFASLPDTLKKKETGFMRRPFLTSQSMVAAKAAGYDVGISLGEDFINALLFLLAEQGSETGTGILDWDIHEVFLKKMGFDGIRDCDEFVPKSSDDRLPTLCNLRPRVGDILGSSLTANGYFPQKHPIMIRTRGSRALAPRVAFFNLNGAQFVELQLGDIEVSFYALKTDDTVPADKFSNLTLKLDENGEPMILSMNPADPDPNNGPIIRLKLSAIIAAEISAISTDEEDPSKLSLTIRPDSTLSRIIFRPVPGGNSTVISEKSIISAFEEKMNYGLSIYSEPKNAIKIKLPKELSFKDADTPDQFTALGLSKISVGSDGLQIKVEDSQEFIDIFAKLSFTQSLFMDLQKKTFQVPE